MKLLKIINGFVTNSSSSSAPLILALKYNLNFSDILKKLGMDINNPFIAELANSLDRVFIKNRFINCPPDRSIDSKDFENYEGYHISMDDIPDDYRSGYQLSSIDVTVQVYSGGGWISLIDAFLVRIGWYMNKSSLEELLEDDLVVIYAGHAEED
ncbi:MAG: hypothetical protein ACTSRP_18665 [Candidatus Helarchaeota archaeon]